MIRFCERLRIFNDILYSLFQFDYAFNCNTKTLRNSCFAHIFTRIDTEAVVQEGLQYSHLSFTKIIRLEKYNDPLRQSTITFETARSLLSQHMCSFYQDFFY